MKIEKYNIKEIFKLLSDNQITLEYLYFINNSAFLPVDALTINGHEVDLKNYDYDEEISIDLTSTEPIIYKIS